MAASSAAEQSLRLIHRLVAEKNFGSQDELKRFLNDEVIGKTPVQLAAMLGGSAAETPLDQAEHLFETLPAGITTAELLRTAKQALELSDQCMSAWLALAIHEKSHRKAAELVEQGLARGRERFAKEIAEAGPDNGLWGYVEARDFMRLLHEKAKLHEISGEGEEALATYREMLALNPGDNQGIRGDALRLLMVFRRIGEGRELLDAYPDDAHTAMAWGRAFVTSIEAMNRTGIQLPAESPEEIGLSLTGYLKSLGPEFTAAMRESKRAAELNPFVPLLFGRGGLMEVEVADMAAFGGPYEAVSYLQQWGPLWHVSGLPMLFLTVSAPRNPKRYLKQGLIGRELAEVMDQLDSYIGRPWWEILHDD